MRQGLTPLRQAWIAERKDVETYAGRPEQPGDNGTRKSAQTVEHFPGLRRPQERANLIAWLRTQSANPPPLP